MVGFTSGYVISDLVRGVINIKWFLTSESPLFLLHLYQLTPYLAERSELMSIIFLHEWSELISTRSEIIQHSPENGEQLLCLSYAPISSYNQEC